MSKEPTTPESLTAIAISALNECIIAMGSEADRMRAEGDIIGLVRAMDKVSDVTDLIGTVKATGQKLYDRVRFSHLPDLMDEKGVHNIAVDGVGQCYLTDDVQVSASDKDALKVWLIDNHLEDMITENVNAQTLSAFVKRRLKAGEPLPNDLLTIRPFVRAAIKSK